MRNACTTRKRQQGAALIILLAIIALSGALFMVTRLNEMSANYTGLQRTRNAEVLARAKQALVAYVATQAAQAGEQNPGHFPCPEPFSAIGTANEGEETAFCSATPAIGRLPWKTLGMDRPVDADAEPLWYVVSNGWKRPNSSTTLVINSETAGQLTVDGRAGDAIALIIAPGRPIDVPACGANAARNQARSTPGPSINPLDYLECYDAAAAAFVTTSAGASNDQVMRVTTADALPLIEAAIATRIEREIVPQLASVYADSSVWGGDIASDDPAYPFPAPFADPSTGASFEGASAACAGGVCQGLLPVAFSNAPGTTSPCTASAGSPCRTNFVNWASPSTIRVKSGTVLGLGSYLPGVIVPGLTWTPANDACVIDSTSVPPVLNCTLHAPSVLGFFTTDVVYEINATVSNIAMAMRRFEAGAVAAAGITVTSGPTTALATSGSAALVFEGRTNAPTTSLLGSLADCGLVGLLPGFTLQCRRVTISVPLTMFPDHQLLDSSHATTGWFMRNEWYRMLHYAVAQPNTAAHVGAADSCTDAAGNCLTVSSLSPDADKRAILLLAGRPLAGQTRPNADLAHYLEEAENRNGNSLFSLRPVGSGVNDRVVVIDALPSP